MGGMRDPGRVRRSPTARMAVVSARSLESLRRMAVGMGAALLLGICACGESGEDVAARDAAALAGPPAELQDTIPRMREVVVVQVGAFDDSSGALQLRDSLAAVGWPGYVRQVRTDSLPPWRVRIAPTRELSVAQLIAAGFSASNVPVALLSDSAVLPRLTVLAERVNGGGVGDHARLRWMTRGDGRAILVVEDAAGASDGAAPDGFLYAAEGDPIVQRDSVWDVAPSPDWKRLAYGSAFLIRASGRDSVGVRQWAAVAGRTNLGVNVIRRNAFQVNGAAGVFGFAQPVVQPVEPDSLNASRLLDQVRRPAPMAGGWRVRWSADGRTVGIGLAPERDVRDDSPAVEWLSMEADGYLLRGTLPPGSGFVVPEWTMGPTIDSAMSSAPGDARRLAIAGGWAESRDGWVSVQGDISGGERYGVGPGTLLAASRSGELLAVLAPDPAANAGAPPMRALLYRLLQ